MYIFFFCFLFFELFRLCDFALFDSAPTRKTSILLCAGFRSIVLLFQSIAIVEHNEQKRE